MYVDQREAKAGEETKYLITAPEGSTRGSMILPLASVAFEMLQTARVSAMAAKIEASAKKIPGHFLKPRWLESVVVDKFYRSDLLPKPNAKSRGSRSASLSGVARNRAGLNVMGSE